MSELVCDACGGPLVKAPERCFICLMSIRVGAPFTHFKRKGLCTPAHPACLEAKRAETNTSPETK